jgi:hypothetical protein
MSAAERIADCWGDEAPDWVVALAGLVDQIKQTPAGRTIGYSPAVVNQVLGNRYAGDMAMVELKVRGALLNLTVDCPVLGEIGADLCLKHQARPLITSNAERIRLWQGCNGAGGVVCPHSFKSKQLGEKSC